MNHKSKALKTAKALTPFQIIGRGIKKGASSVGKALHKHFIEPEKNRKKIYNEKMAEMDRKAKAGEFN